MSHSSLFSSFRDTFGRAILGSLRVQSNPKQTGFRVERGRQNLPNDDKLGYTVRPTEVVPRRGLPLLLILRRGLPHLCIFVDFKAWATPPYVLFVD